MRHVLLTLALALACAHPPSPAPAPPDVYRTVVAAPDRSPKDRERDAGRKPAELLAFIGAQPGWKVAELAAGDGYTTELLARTVAPGGTVYAENPKFVRENFVAQVWPEHLKAPAMKNVVRVDKELEDPFPPEATRLDAVVINLFYHDTYWLEVNRRKMNEAVFKALRPGGFYVVIDHSAKDGAGSTMSKELHRVEEQLVRSEVEFAGFTLKESADFLRNPQDTRDWQVFAKDKRGTTDRFALKFVKPL